MKALDAMVTYVLDTPSRMSLVIRSHIVTAYWTAGKNRATEIKERMEAAYREFASLLKATNLGTVPNEDLVASAEALSAYLDFASAQDDAMDALRCAVSVCNAVEPLLVRYYEQTSKFSSRSTELLNLLRAMDVGTLRVVAAVAQRSLSGPKLQSLRDDWMPFAERTLYRHGITGLGNDGLVSVLQLVVGPGSEFDREAMTRAMGLVEELRESGVDPTPAAYRILMAAWQRARFPDLEAGEKLDRAAELADILRGMGHVLTADDYSVLLGCCRPLGREAQPSGQLLRFLAETTVLAHQRHNVASDIHIKPTRHPFSSANDVDPRLTAVEAQVLEGNVHYDAALVTALLEVLCSGGRYEEAYRTLAMLRSSGVSVPIELYNRLIEASADDPAASRTALASLRFDMLRHGLIMNRATYSSLLKCCETIGDMATAAELKEQMDQSN